MSYYEGTYASNMEGMSSGARRTAAPTAADLDARNPLRQAYRRAPGVSGTGVGGMSQSQVDEAIMRPR